ncbi:MAG TPA: hypothetical protein VMM60_15925 [Ilumatobacter sp.]|nr:hypothetical protein [Ilumatobacter sp.]
MTALSDLRRTRRARRLGDTEWFDLAYRVYLAAMFGGGAAIVLADYVGDDPVGASGLSDLFRHGPAVLGVLAAIAFAIGLRGGAEGGPISIEPADVRHLLLAPISRTAVLRRPLLQRLRTMVGGGALAGGLAGLLTAQRLPGDAFEWTCSGAAFGACVASLLVSGAAVWHGLQWPAWAATALGTALVGWQLAAAFDIIGSVPGPFDSIGGLAFWAHAQHPTDLIGAGVAIALIVAGFALVGRLRVEHLARRGDLVSQLRFAVTMQDLRTVVLLRRQLREERLRARPWVRIAPRAGGPITGALRRATFGFARTPLARVGRIAATAAAAGVMAGVAARGTTPAIGLLAITLYVLGLELVEPLSQEIDHPDRTMALPQHDGWVHQLLLVPSLVAAIPMAMIGALACSLVDPPSTRAAFALAVFVAWCGVGGAAVSVVRDSVTEMAGPKTDGLVMPPEVSGFGDVLKLAIPIIVAGIGGVPIVAMRAEPTVGTLVRCLIGLVLYLSTVRWWIARRTDLRRQWRDFIAGAKQ